jgi:hypothetical protein
MILRWATATLLALALALAGTAPLLRPATARADHAQTAIIEDGRVLAHPDLYLARFRALGAQTVRILVNWASIAPHWQSRGAPEFNDADPNSYPQANWAPYDAVVRKAADYGLNIEFTLTGGAPLWAEGPGVPRQGNNPNFAWKPDPTRFRHFVHAVGERYDGAFTPDGESTPLPAVRFWTIWNEPNFGEDLGPEAVADSTVPNAPRMYRNLVAAAWASLLQTGNRHDQIVIGGLAAQGLVHRPSRKYPLGLPGDYGQMKPLTFIRALYCLDDHSYRLRGGFARAVGCPTTASGYASFRARNPGLFNATGVADHPYTGGSSPLGIKHNDPSYATFSQLGNLERTLDAVNRAYGSHRRYPIYSDEFGFITRPPQISPFVSPARAAYYLNWSEYLSWRSPRVVSFAQYLLEDPLPTGRGAQAGFASGLLTFGDQPKATFYAYRLPLYLPRTEARAGRTLQVWGDARPAAALNLAASQPTVDIQFEAHGRGPFRTVRRVRITSRQGYFDVRQGFAGSGNVRLRYVYPTTERLLSDRVAGQAVFSRVVPVVIR